MKMSDWNILRTLYECPNLTQASKILYLSQPTLTKRLRLMEEELGVTIALRGKKGLQFTPEGEYLAVKAVQFSSLMEEIRLYLSATSADVPGVLSIGATNSMTRSTLPEIFQTYQLRHPHLQINITTDRSSILVKLVEQGKLDLAFINGDIPFSGRKLLYRQEQAQIASIFPIDMEHLEQYPYITYVHDPFTHRVLEDWWYHDYSTPFPTGLVLPHGDLCKELILKGLGYSIFFVKEYMSGHYECLSPIYYKNGKPLTRNTWLIYTEKGKRNPYVQDFIDSISPENSFSVEEQE